MCQGVPVNHKHDQWETFSEVEDVEHCVLGSSAFYQSASADVSIVEKDPAKEYTPWDLRDLTNEDDHGSFGLQYAQKL